MKRKQVLDIIEEHGKDDYGSIADEIELILKRKELRDNFTSIIRDLQREQSVRANVTKLVHTILTILRRVVWDLELQIYTLRFMLIKY